MKTREIRYSSNGVPRRREKMGTTYIGLVIDTLHNGTNHRTRRYTTWEAAHHAAVALARRYGIYRYAWCKIDVESN